MKKKQKKIFFGVLFFLIIFFLVGFSNIFDNNLKKIITKATSESYQLGDNVSESLAQKDNPQDVYQENQSLKNKISFLEQRIINLEKSIDEQFDFQGQIDFLDNNNFDYRTAKITNKGFNQNKNIFILDKGEKDGVQKGMVAVSSYGTVLGKIIFVEQNISWLLLLNDIDSSISASVLRDDFLAGSVEGDRDGSLTLKYISKDSIIEKNDILMTSGIEDNVPQGLLIGEIADIKRDDRQMFAEATVWQASEIKDVNFVNIVFPK
jgi:rod shape-determining protein MreC